MLAHAGTGSCFAVNAVSFVAVILALWRIRIPSPQATTRSLSQSLRDGLAHVGGNPVLRLLTLLGFAGSFLAFPLITFLPVIAGGVLRTGAQGYSLLLSSFGSGAIVGAIVTAQRGRAAGRGRASLAAFVVYGLATLGALLATSQWAAMALLLVSGFFLVTAFSTVNSLVQENVPDALKGRVLGIYGLAFRGGGPLGSLIAGPLVRGFGAPAVMGTFSLLLALAAASVWLKSDRVRSL